jgi:transitional endoplasmic reticulum ATPase
VEFPIKRGEGNGFEDIAGMCELKESLNKQVVFVIKNKEVAEEYRITPPNGMLLYGPPGCGKTFFAEKFAEETGFNYMLIKSSDLASSYVHGSQEKIRQLFDQAEQNAPIVVCFDEFDALVPDRSWNNVSSEEVNEFLSQMNNCSKRGIFIVATSNRPDKIDPAVLRTGRIDKMAYVPLPDYEARKEMFALYLKDRPKEDGIDVEELANMTEGYIASDIAYIVNDAAMVAAYTRTKISKELLLSSVTATRPSVRSESIKQYDDIRRKMEDKNRRNVTDRSVVRPW